MAVLSICIAGAAEEGWLCAEAIEAIAVVSAQTERVANATSRVDVMEVSFDSGAVRDCDVRVTVRERTKQKVVPANTDGVRPQD
jgi:hypothetical protein